MIRIAIITFALLFAGVWIHPWMSGAWESTPDSSAQSAPPVLVIQEQPAEPQFKTLRGENGYWRIGQTDQGVWWFISPRGKPEFLNTVTTVQPYQLARGSDGPHFISRDWNGGAGPDGDLNHWAYVTLQRIRDTGFKGLGAWCHPAFHDLDVPMTRDLNVWAWMSGASSRLYSPDWSTIAEYAIQVQTQPLRDNKNLVGYFIDNELDWGDSGVGPSAYFDYLPEQDPNRQEVLRVIRSVWTTLEGFNAAWNTQLQDWVDLDQWQTIPHAQPQAYSQLFNAWLGHLAEDYFRITSSLIRKYDPNHLILGVRFKGDAPLEVVRASRGYTDAQSLNYYVGDARLDMELFRMMHEESGQPILIGEYSFHALDGRSGNRNTVGFAAQVLDQHARADGYRLSTTRLARIPYVIGADWFQWNDEPPGGRINDGEDVNFGVVDIDDRPYDLLADSIRQTTPQLNSLHANSAADEQQDVWRESFAVKPVADIPFLSTPPILNGELSDWPSQARLSGLRHSQTVGLDRSSIPLPNIHIGWTHEGLYVGMEIFDNNVQGAPPAGWWWTRDNVEFWLSTRPVASDQNRYDIYSHQFFFVPTDYPAGLGLAGVFGQWHRAGDALNDNLIPHPAAKSVARILPDRYVAEIFIPAQAMHGYDPISQPAMAFNIHVRNFQHAIDYFWSAPKEVLTQLRPRTWGDFHLQPPPAEQPTLQAKAE